MPISPQVPIKDSQYIYNDKLYWRKWRVEDFDKQSYIVINKDLLYFPIQDNEKRKQYIEAQKKLNSFINGIFKANQVTNIKDLLNRNPNDAKQLFNSPLFIETIFPSQMAAPVVMEKGSHGEWECRMLTGTDQTLQQVDESMHSELKNCTSLAQLQHDIFGSNFLSYYGVDLKQFKFFEATHNPGYFHFCPSALCFSSPDHKKYNQYNGEFKSELDQVIKTATQKASYTADGMVNISMSNSIIPFESRSGHDIMTYITVDSDGTIVGVGYNNSNELTGIASVDSYVIPFLQAIKDRLSDRLKDLVEKYVDTRNAYLNATKENAKGSTPDEINHCAKMLLDAYKTLEDEIVNFNIKTQHKSPTCMAHAATMREHVAEHGKNTTKLIPTLSMYYDKNNKQRNPFCIEYNMYARLLGMHKDRWMTFIQQMRSFDNAANYKELIAEELKTLRKEIINKVENVEKRNEIANLVNKYLTKNLHTTTDRIDEWNVYRKVNALKNYSKRIASLQNCITWCEKMNGFIVQNKVKEKNNTKAPYTLQSNHSVQYDNNIKNISNYSKNPLSVTLTDNKNNQQENYIKQQEELINDAAHHTKQSQIEDNTINKQIE